MPGKFNVPLPAGCDLVFDWLLIDYSNISKLSAETGTVSLWNTFSWNTEEDSFVFEIRVKKKKSSNAATTKQGQM